MKNRSTATVALLSLVVSAVSISIAQAQTTAQLKYQQWAAQHSDWVRLHPDRARFFATHEDAAEKARQEWADWRGDKAQFSTWAEAHPGWVNSHKDRAEYFRAHPDLAEKSRHEWAEHKESRNEFTDYSKARGWNDDHHDAVRHDARDNHHDNGRHEGEDRHARHDRHDNGHDHHDDHR